jgi:hypothetical protein
MFKFSGDKIGMEKDDKQLLGAAAVIGGIMAAGSPKGQKLIGKGIKKIKDYTSKAAPVTKPKPPKGPYKPGKNPYSDYEQNIMGHKIVDDEKKIKFQA